MPPVWERPADVRGSHLALAEGGVKATLAGRGGLSAAAFTTKGIAGRMPAVGATLSWQRAGSPLGLRAGWIGEPETLLGSVGEGAFGAVAADTSFVGGGCAHRGGRVADRRQRGAWDGRAGGAWGADPPGVFAGHQRVRASRQPGAGRCRGVALFRVAAVAGRERTGLVDGAGRPEQGGRGAVQHGAGGSCAQRPADGYHGSMAPTAWARASFGWAAVYSHRPGHREAADPELTFLGGWRWEF